MRRENNSYGHSDATKSIMSKATAKAIAEGRLPRVSKIEGVVAKELRGVGVSFVRQFAIRDALGRFACVFDFFVPTAKTVIEVNGTFFHADPRFYPNGPVSATQRRNAKAWSRKVGIIKELDLRLVEIWEYDIKEDATNAVRTACECILS